MDAVRCVIDAAHIVCSTRPVSVLHGTSMSLKIPSRSRNFYSRSHSSQPVVKRCVYDIVIPVCSSMLPVTERHDVESGTVSRPIAATCNVTATMPREQEYALLSLPRDYHSGHPRSRQSCRTKDSLSVPRDFYLSCSCAVL